MSERSASAIQIEERQKRLDAMLNLAKGITEKLIFDMLKQNPKLTLQQILTVMKTKDFSISAFKNEYMMLPDCAVQQKTVKQYFSAYMNRLNPTFVETKVGYFRLSDSELEKTINETIQAVQPKPKT